MRIYLKVILKISFRFNMLWKYKIIFIFMTNSILLLQLFPNLARLLTNYTCQIFLKGRVLLCWPLSQSSLVKCCVRWPFHNFRAAKFLAAVETEVNIFLDEEIKNTQKALDYTNRQICLEKYLHDSWQRFNSHIMPKVLTNCQ